MKSVREFLFGNTKHGSGPEEGPCNVAGHDWGEGELYGYFTDGVPHFGFDDSWTIRKKVFQECSKCGNVKFERKYVGEVHVDSETDEITVVDNETLK